MKYSIFSVLLLFAGCIHDGGSTPAPVATKWIDVAHRTDTIITNVSGNGYLIYYAIKNWQSLGDSSFTHGLRQIVATKQDSVFVSEVNSTSKYYGPYRIAINNAGDTIFSQNFIDTTYKTSSRPFIKLPQ